MTASTLLSMTDEMLERIGKAIADPRRRELLEIVAKSPGLACGELVERLGVSQPTVSHHIGQLMEAELLESVRDGKCSRLTANRETIARYFDEMSRRLTL